MRRRTQLALLLVLAVCLSAARAQALTLAYDRNYSTAYANLLQHAADVQIMTEGHAAHLRDLFQDGRVDAVELYDFEAERFLRGTSEPLYWYPHFTATIVLAVHEDASFAVDGWADLRQRGTIVLPDTSPEREIFLLALTQRLTDGTDAGYAQMQQLKKSGRLRFYPVRGGIRHILWGAGKGDVYVLFAHEADRLIRRGARLRVVVPADGTLSMTKGILSRTPIRFAETLSGDLAAAGYPPLLPSAAPALPPDFLRALRTANSRYHREILERPALTPAEPHERFALLTLMLPITVIWGACIRRRMLHQGARRAVLLLTAMLLLWEIDRMVKILTFAHDAALERMLWYLYYVFRAGLSVALLWIAWASDEDVRARAMPPWLKAVFGFNLLLAALVLCNDLHHQFFYFTWSTRTLEWSEHMAWGGYAYWTIWFIEIFAALLLLLEKAKAQDVLRVRMTLPFLLFALFVIYSISLQYVDWVQWPEMTAVTALFFLALVELCLRTGLMPSNSFHQAFFTHSHLAMQLTDEAGRTVFASSARTPAPTQDIRTSRMALHGGALIWQEDLTLLHERQRQLALTREALFRSRAVLQEEHTIRKNLLALMLRRRLSDDLEAILAAKRPQLRDFREQLMETRDEAQVTRLIRRLNLLSSYLKKRCVLFLKGQEDGQIRADELSMAVSETCSYLRPLGLRAGVEWAQQEPLPAASALALFDLFAELLTRAAEEGMESVFCRFEGGGVSFLLERADWIDPWAAAWQERHGHTVTISDRGYALSLTVAALGAPLSAHCVRHFPRFDGGS